MKQCVLTVICYLLIPVIVLASDTQLKCPSCTYITTDADIPSLARSAIDGILNLFQEPKCVGNLKSAIPEILEETCETISGQVPRCSYYKGRIDLTIPLPLIPEVPIQIYQRGCVHYKRANVPSIGCHRRQDINEDATVIKQFLNKVSSTFESYELANFQGDVCIYEDTYGQKTAGVSSNTMLSPIIMLLTVCVSFVLI